MSKRNPQSARGVRTDLAQIHTKLDRLDEAIRGNGKLGVLTRLDRLEQIEVGRRRLTWIVIGAFVSAGASALLQLVQLLGG